MAAHAASRLYVGCTTLNAFRLHAFHSNQALFAKQDMAPIASILHSVRTIAEIVRTGDIGAVAFSVSSVLNKQVVVEMRTHARTVSHTRKRASERATGRDGGWCRDGKK